MFHTQLHLLCAVSASCTRWMESPLAKAGGGDYISQEPLCGLRPEPGRAAKEKGLFLASVSFPLGASAGRLFCLFLFSLSFLFQAVQSMATEWPEDALFPLGFYRTFKEPITPFHMIGFGLERKEVRFLGR